MKAKIHPQWYKEAKISCACGHSFTAGSTKPEIKVEICGKCHPFFTGEMKFIDTQGRVEKFQAKQKAISTGKYIKKSDRRKEAEKKEQEKPKTIREMLQQNS